MLPQAVPLLRALACLLVLVPADSRLLKGIRAEEQDYYEKGGEMFRCLDGSGDIPIQLVNDDYCDCADGSDEPGTAACSNGSFYCINNGHVGEAIFSSRVNDGVCDCCDASDEYDGHAECPNNCAAVAAHNAAAVEQQRKVYLEGSAKYEEYSRIGEAGVKSLQQEKTAHQTILAERKAALDAATERKDEQEKLEKLEREKIEKEGEQQVFAQLGLTKLNEDQLRALVLKIARAQPKSQIDSEAGVLDGHREVVLDATNAMLTQLAGESAVDPIGEWRKVKEEANSAQKAKGAPDSTDQMTEEKDSIVTPGENCVYTTADPASATDEWCADNCPSNCPERLCSKACTSGR
jgi:hypothetical protein